VINRSVPFSLFGRFIAQDPIGLRGSLNTYAYASGNPQNFTDPLGLTPYLPGFAGTASDAAALGVMQSPAVQYAKAAADYQLLQDIKRCLHPDMENATVGGYVFSYSGTITRDGNIYSGGGATIKGLPNFASFGFSVTATYLLGDSSLANVNGYAGGLGYSYEYYDVVGGGIGYSPGTGWAVTVGVGLGTNVKDVPNVGSVGASVLNPWSGNYDASKQSSICSCQ
jgi:hypothetical protein